MNSQSLRIVKNFTRVVIFILASFVHVSVRAWEVDMSRRRDANSGRMPAQVVTPEQAPVNLVENIFENIGPTHDVVILHTEKGFVPESVKLKKGQNYKIHVVNVDEKQKNVSFVFDAFSEFHATYFGAEKTFSISPKNEGIFSFVCPETAKQGRVIIVGGDEKRKLASE